MRVVEAEPHAVLSFKHLPESLSGSEEVFFLPIGGLMIAFQNYQPYLGIAKSEWVGFHFYF
jgi:hypothetical protein